MFDIRDESPDNELLRLISETWPDQIVYLPLIDPLFAQDGIPINIESTIEVAALADHYDAVILLPVTTLIPIPGT